MQMLFSVSGTVEKICGWCSLLLLLGDAEKANMANAYF